jgi:hypothetical protein
MNPHILAALSRERQRELEADYARGDLLGSVLRSVLARGLRRAGEGLFRLGVALDDRVTSVPAVETNVR